MVTAMVMITGWGDGVVPTAGGASSTADAIGGERVKDYATRKEELEPREASIYRGVAARANYIAADRPDLMYAVKDICRGMAEPT